MFENQKVDIGFVPKNALEWRTARDDFRWFAERFILIADKNASKPHPLFLNPTQRRILQYLQTYKNSTGGGNYLIYKARQIGVSTLVSALFAHAALTRPGFKAMQMAHERIASSNLLAMIKLCYNGLPDKIKVGEDYIMVKPKDKAENRNELWIVFDEKGIEDSRVLIEEATAGVTAGISFSFNAIHYSEVGKKAFDSGDAIATSMQTLSSNGVAIAEGTPDGAYGWMYDTWQEASDDFARFQEYKKSHPHARYDGWVPIFCPWFYHYALPLEEGEVIEPENEWETLAMAGENTYRHYKCTPENIKAMRWIIRTRLPKTLEMTKEQWRAQEYPSNPVEGFIVTGSAYFNPAVVQHGLAWANEFVNKHAATIKRYQFDGSGNFVSVRGRGEGRNVWHFVKDPEPTKYKYVIAGDCAEGLEKRDWDTAVVIEIRPGEPNWVIGYWRAHEQEKLVHAMQIHAWAKLLRASAVAIERNEDGKAVNAFLENLSCPGLYVLDKQDEGSFAVGYHKRYGWATNSKTRGIMLGQLQASLLRWHQDSNDPEGLVCPFPEIWNELRTFTKINKRAEAARGSYDDLVIALAIGNAVAQDIMPKVTSDDIARLEEQNYYKHLLSIGMPGMATLLRKVNYSKRKNQPVTRIVR